MKLPLLLTQFLYQNKKLDLPGIGSFSMDPSAVIPEEVPKDLKARAVGITFVQVAVPEPDTKLIDYIKAHTGKIRPLAAADLDSFLSLGTELLNIGKPFYLEGIGTLSKGQDGRYSFQPGEYTTTKLEEAHPEPMERTSRVQPLSEQEISEQPGESQSKQKWLLVSLIALGLAVIGWGGYYFSKKYSGRIAQSTEPTAQQVQAAADSARQAAQTADSLRAAQQAAVSTKQDSARYKFIILQTSNKERALKRYSQLLSYDLKPKLYTRDSSFFKVYFTIYSAAQDTARIKDSLQKEYAHSVSIER